jgi:hypothetical protein
MVGYCVGGAFYCLVNFLKKSKFSEIARHLVHLR